MNSNTAILTGVVVGLLSIVAAVFLGLNHSQIQKRQDTKQYVACVQAGGSPVKTYSGLVCVR